MANLVRVKEKFQVTIPVDIRRQLALREGDYLEASVAADGIMLRPKKLVEAVDRTPSLVSFLMERRTAQRSRAEIDSAMAADRNSWNK